MTEFEQYMQLYEVDPVRLSIAAKVRYLTVYNAQKRHPLMPENAKKIKDAVLRMTGVPYVGSFVLIELNDDQFRSLHIKQLPRNHFGGQGTP